MTDQLVDSLETVNQFDTEVSASREIGPSGHPIVRTEDGVITEGSRVHWDKKAIL